MAAPSAEELTWLQASLYFDRPHRRRNSSAWPLRTIPSQAQLVFNDTRSSRRSSYDPVHPRHRHIPSPSSTKSILTRTSSVSTNHTASNKSVKFATLPTVYSHPGLPRYPGNCWDLDPDNKSVDINIDSMDLDHDPFANYRSRGQDDDDDDEEEEEEEVEEEEEASFHLQDNHQKTEQKPSVMASLPSTHDRDRDKLKSNRVKRLLTFARKSSVTPHPHRTAYSAPTSPTSSRTAPRPVISSPYPLGSYPPLRDILPYTNTHTLNSSSASSLNAPQRPWTKNLHGAHSASSESLQSLKTTGAFSMRSIDSFGSGVAKFKDWLGKTFVSGRSGGPGRG